MPWSPSEAFLLWHEAAASGRWRDLLAAPATKDVIWALWLLQSYPLSPPSPDRAVNAAIAAGWGR